MSTQAIFSKKQNHAQPAPPKKTPPKNSEKADTAYKRTELRTPISVRSLKNRAQLNHSKCRKTANVLRANSICHKRNREPINRFKRENPTTLPSEKKALKNRVQEKKEFPLPSLRDVIKTGFFVLGTIYGGQQKSPIFCPFTPFPGACLGANLIGNAMAEYTFSTPAFNPYNQTFTQPQNGNTVELSNGDLMNVMVDQNVLVRQRIGLNGTDFSTIGPTITSTTLKNPQVTALTSGTYAVSGINSNQLASIQFYSANDQPVGTPLEIQFYGTTHFEPRVTTLVGGDVLMTWARLNSGNHWLYYTRLRWTGSSWSTIAGPSVYQSGQADKASCFPLSNGGYILTGHVVSAGYARPVRFIYDSSDNQIASGYINTLNSAYQQTQVRGAQLSNGKHAIAWLVSSATNSNAVSVSYRIFDTNNNPIGAESSIPLSLPIWGSEDVVLDIAAIDDGFTISLTANTDGSSTDVFEQRFDLSGTNVTGIDQVGNNLNGTRPFVTRISGTSRRLFTWLANSPKEVYLKLFQLFNDTMSTTSPPTTTPFSSQPSTTTSNPTTTTSQPSTTNSTTSSSTSQPSTTTSNPITNTSQPSTTTSTTSSSSSMPSTTTSEGIPSSTSVSTTSNQSTPRVSTSSSSTSKIIARISSSSTPLGLILGAIFGTVAFFIFIAALIGGFIWKRRKKQTTTTELQMTESPYVKTFNPPKKSGETEQQASSKKKPTEREYVNVPPDLIEPKKKEPNREYVNVPRHLTEPKDSSIEYALFSELEKQVDAPKNQKDDSNDSSQSSMHQNMNVPPHEAETKKTGTEYVPFGEVEKKYATGSKESTEKKRGNWV